MEVGYIDFVIFVGVLSVAIQTPFCNWLYKNTKPEIENWCIIIFK